jgi:hypothetical protein
VALRVGLTYTQMKLSRAHEHLDQLKREITAFIKSKPYTETRYDCLEKAGHIIRVEQHITPDPIGVLIGEFAYCVRSSLDHLAWQLALLTTDKPSRLTAFPIESVCPSPSNKGFNEKIASMPPQALKVVDDLQPYHSQATLKSHPLWQINRLCNLDKHQVIPISSINFELAIFGVSQARRRDTNHATEIVVPLSEKEKVEFHVDVTGVVFGDPIDVTDGVSDFEIEADGLDAIYQFVRDDAVPRFEVFFPK